MRHMAATLALAFAATPILAQDRAVPRGGGSSGGGGGSSSGASHHSGGSSSSGSSSSSYSGSSESSSSSSSSRSMSPAERRHPRAGTGTGDRYPYYGYGGGYYPGYAPWYPWYYPSSYYYGPYWGSYYYGYWPYGAYYGGGYYHSYRTSDAESSAVRLIVDPEDAKVYVDGYYAGTVDDFDGLSQLLYVQRGLHEILLKRDGYRAQRFRIYAVPGQTMKIDSGLAKGDGEEPLKDLSGGRGGEFAERRPRPEPEDEEGPPEDDDASRPRVRVEEGQGVPSGGTLRLKVLPTDASVYVDGTFRGTARQLRSLNLTPGPHRVELVRPGFATSQHEVLIDVGRTEDLSVTLEQP